MDQIQAPRARKLVNFLKNLLTCAREALESDLQLDFWKQKDLPVKKIESWMEEFQLTEDQILNQLRYAAFEWEEKTEQEIPRPVGLFFTVLKKRWFFKIDREIESEGKRSSVGRYVERIF